MGPEGKHMHCTSELSLYSSSWIFLTRTCLLK